MKEQVWLPILFGTLALGVLAQAETPVTTNEFPKSDAVTMEDVTTVSIAPDGSFEAVRHAGTKVLTDRGRRAGETVIPFSAKHQSVEFRYAKSLLPDGAERNVDADSLQTGKLFPGHPAYHDARAVRYRLPSVVAGATVEQEYVLKATPLMGDHFWMIWRIRSGQPVLETRLVLRMPAQRKFEWRVRNAELQPEVAESTDKKWKTYTWHHSAPTDLDSEPYMPPVDEILPWLEISTAESWEAVAKWLDEISRSKIDSSEEISGRVQTLTAGLSDVSEKVAALYYWLEDNFRFVNVDLALAAYEPRPASQVYASRYGDAKDLSVLLAAMLQDAGIQAKLAFLESGSARKIGEFLPTPRRLTHCIVVAEADGKTYYLDATAETARHDVILGRLCNTELVLLGKDANRLVPGPVYDGTRHGTIERVKATLAADGSLQGEVRTEFLGESDAFIRSALKYTSRQQLNELMEQEVRKNLPEGKLLDYEVADVMGRDRNFVTSYRFETPSWAEATANKLVFKSQLLQKIEIANDFFKSETRQLPIWFYESAPSRVEIELTLPEGFAVQGLPKELDIENAFSVWKRTIRQEGNRLLISESSHLKTAKLSKDAVAEIRKYYDQALAHKKEEVVLVKK